MEGNKVTTYAVVALVVGILVGVGVGYAAFHGSDNNNSSSSTNETYWFYLYFGDNDERSAWYSASGTNIKNANDAFSSAMDGFDMKYEVSSYGYIGSIDGVDGNGGGWYLAQYLYTSTSADAAQASVSYPVDDYGTMRVSNGWAKLAGFDSTSGPDLKLWEFNTNIFFMSPYNADWSAASPASTFSLWSTTGPFATA